MRLLKTIDLEYQFFSDGCKLSSPFLDVLSAFASSCPGYRMCIDEKYKGLEISYPAYVFVHLSSISAVDIDALEIHINGAFGIITLSTVYLYSHVFLK